MRLASDFLQSKTTRLMAVALLGILALYVQGQMDWRAALVAAILALQKAFDRDTIARTQEDIVAQTAWAADAQQAAIDELRADLVAQLVPAVQQASEMSRRVLDTSQTILSASQRLNGGG